MEYIEKKFMGYDCAKNFDKAVAVSDLDRSINLLESLSQNKNMQTHQLLKYGELMDNGCFITVKSWADDSDYEAVIWQNDWKLLSYVNQLWLHEIDCDNLEMCKAVAGIQFLINNAKENSNFELGNQIQKEISNP